MLVWACALFSFGVVREGDLLVRWTFDEGNGSVANDVTGGGIDLLLSAYAGWGSEDVNNTAISKHSLSLMSGDSYGRALSNDKLKATGSFTYLMWFKTNGQPDSYSQILSKRRTAILLIFCKLSRTVEVSKPSYALLGLTT